jgi:Rrf2 family protein
MIYSRSSEYAIRAFVYLAAMPEGKLVMAKQIAEETQIPAYFLAKILQQLARKGHLRSSKGPTGGFALNQPAERICMLEVIEAVDGLGSFKRCISGMSECTDATPCGLHESWKPVRGHIVEYLQGTMISDVAKSLEEKRRSLTRPRKTKRAGTKRA